MSKLPEADRKLIERFLEKVRSWAPPTLEGVVLFGSMVRGEFGASSDIDLLMIFDEPNPEQHLAELTALITVLKPHREVRPVLTNLKDIGPDLLGEIMWEGEVLYGKLMLTPERLALKPYSIISYDLGSSSSTVRQRVARRVYGYTSRKKVGRRVKEYQYGGLAARRDCYVLGKGVIALPLKTAREFIDFLRENGVKVMEHEAYM